MLAQTEIDADSPEQAVKMAKALWKNNHRNLIVPGAADEASAYDWQPNAEQKQEKARCVNE